MIIDKDYKTTEFRTEVTTSTFSYFCCNKFKYQTAQNILIIPCTKPFWLFLALNPFNIHKDIGKIREQTLGPECLVSTPNPNCLLVV